MTRKIRYLNGRPFVYVSNHPLEERIVFLTEAYRDFDGSLILPELLAWDGVSNFWWPPDV